MNQVVAGIKKEWIYMWRGFRFGGIVLLFVLSALGSPLIVMLAEMIADASGDTLSEIREVVDVKQGLASAAYVGSLSFISSLTTWVTIIMSGAAGAEQKKRSIIIPQTAGLTPTGYVLPKFIFYPALVFAATVLSSFLANATCYALFEASLPPEIVLLSSSVCGVYSVFIVCMYLFLGISLAAPHLSILFVVLINAIVPSVIMEVFKINKYTPWNLSSLGLLVAGDDALNNLLGEDVADEISLLFEEAGVSLKDIGITVIITVALCILFAVLTWVVMTAKKVDNTSDEVY